MEFTMGIIAPPGQEGPQIKGYWEEEAHTLYIFIFSKKHCNFIHINTLLCYLTFLFFFRGGGLILLCSLFLLTPYNGSYYRHSTHGDGEDSWESPGQ